MPLYSISMTFPESTVKASRYLPSSRDARKWGQLCLDICGKDEHGRKYVGASVTNARGQVLQTWPIAPRDETIRS